MFIDMVTGHNYTSRQSDDPSTQGRGLIPSLIVLSVSQPSKNK